MKLKNIIGLIVGSFAIGVLIILLFIFAKFSAIDGYSNAINKAGSERMRTILLGYQGTTFSEALKNNLSGSEYKKQITETIIIYDEILTGLIEGSEKHGISGTTDVEIIASISTWNKEWVNFKDELNKLTKLSSYSSKVESYKKGISIEKSGEIKNLANDVVLLYTNRSNQAYAFIKKLLVLLIIFVLISSLFIVFVISKTLSPISSILKTIQHIASGDLTQNINFSSNNEIGEISESISMMSDSYNRLIGDISSSSESVKATNQDLNKSYNNTLSAVNNIIENIVSIDDSLTIQEKAISESSKAVNVMRQQTYNINESMGGQTAAISENSASIEEMVSSIESVSKNTEKANSISANLLGTAKDGGKDIHTALLSIKEIQEESNKISQAVEGIVNITSITSLLAMNAAIEAAHAGVAGKGFAVVAGEIGKLATNSSIETAKIQQIVKATSEKIDISTSLASKAEDAFNVILNDISVSANLSNEIATSLDEQAIASRDILHNTGHIVNLSNEVRDILEEAKKEADNVENSMTDLNSINSDIVNISRTLKDRGNVIEKSVNMLSDVAGHNSQVVDNLENNLSQFKIKS